MQPSQKADLAYEAMRRAILEQALVPGTKLPEDTLGAQFGVSRTLTRAVLARLAGEGLVETGNKRTATVAQPSLDEARAVFEVRRALEAEVVRQVVARWQPAFGATLEGHVREEEQAARGGPSPVSIRLAAEFHVRLAQLAGNPLLARFVTEVVTRCALIFAVYGQPHTQDCGIQEHREIIAALRKGETARAVALMDHHLGCVESRALPGATEDDTPDLASILGRYAAAALPPAGSVNLARAERRARPAAPPAGSASPSRSGAPARKPRRAG